MHIPKNIHIQFISGISGCFSDLSYTCYFYVSYYNQILMYFCQKLLFIFRENFMCVCVWYGHIVRGSWAKHIKNICFNDYHLFGMYEMCVNDVIFRAMFVPSGINLFKCGYFQRNIKMTLCCGNGFFNDEIFILLNVFRNLRHFSLVQKDEIKETIHHTLLIFIRCNLENV